MPSPAVAYQGHTVPHPKKKKERAELLLCETQVCLGKANSGPGAKVGIILKSKEPASLCVPRVLIGSGFVCVFCQM